MNTQDLNNTPPDEQPEQQNALQNIPKLIPERVAEQQGYTDGGRNMFFEGRFDGESEREQSARLRWADDMRAAFERHTGNGWFDKDWKRETALWASAWNACIAKQQGWQEPVARVRVFEYNGAKQGSFCEAVLNDCLTLPDDTPLYLHPAPGLAELRAKMFSMSYETVSSAGRIVRLDSIVAEIDKMMGDRK